MQESNILESSDFHFKKISEGMLENLVKMELNLWGLLQ